MTQTIALYRDGRRVPGADADGPLEARLARAIGERRDGDLLWVLLERPDDAALAAVAEALELDEHAVTRLARARRPRLVRHAERDALVVRTLRYDDGRDAVETGDLSVLYAPGLVVTVADPAPAQQDSAHQDSAHQDSAHQDSAQPDTAGRVATEASTAPVDPEAVRRDLEDDPTALARRGADAVLHALLSAVVDSYLDVCAGLQGDVEEVETSVFSPERTHDSQRIYVLKRELAEVRRAVLPLRDALRRLVTDGDQPAGAPHVRDVVDRLLGVAEQVESLEGLLGTAFDAHLARIQVQQNDDMRKISAGVALVAGPTLVAAVYGMNFRDMPELHWALGYPFALGLMALVSLLTWIGFKRSGWL